MIEIYVYNIVSTFEESFSVFTDVGSNNNFQSLILYNEITPSLLQFHYKFCRIIFSINMVIVVDLTKSPNKMIACD